MKKKFSLDSLILKFRLAIFFYSLFFVGLSDKEIRIIFSCSSAPTQRKRSESYLNLGLSLFFSTTHSFLYSLIPGLCSFFSHSHSRFFCTHSLHIHEPNTRTHTFLIHFGLCVVVAVVYNTLALTYFSTFFLYLILPPHLLPTTYNQQQQSSRTHRDRVGFL